MSEDPNPLITDKMIEQNKEMFPVDKPENTPNLFDYSIEIAQTGDSKEVILERLIALQKFANELNFKFEEGEE